MHQYDAIVWTLKLNYSRTRCQNFSGDQGSGRKLHQERLLLTLKQKFLKFFSWIRHGDSTRWLGMKQNLRPNWYQPLHYPPSPGKVVHTTRVYAHYSLWIAMWVLLRPLPQESEQWKSCETGPTVCLPYPRRLECLQQWQQKTLSVSPAGI